MNINNKRKGTPKKKGVFKKRRFNNSAANNVGALAIPKPEVKNIDTVSSLAQVVANFGTWTTPVLINGIAGGTTRTTRVGGSVTLTKVQVRSALSTTGGNSMPSTRIAVIYDKQPMGALPAITDIWAADSFNSPLNISNSDRFLVICDEYPREMQGLDVPGTGGIAWKCFKKLQKPGYQQKFFNTNGGAIADIACGAIYIMMATSATTPAATTGIGLAFYARCRFTDA